MPSGRVAHSDKCLFQLLLPWLHSFHCWIPNLGLELTHNLRTPEDYHLHIRSLWAGRNCLWRLSLPLGKRGGLLTWMMSVTANGAPPSWKLARPNTDRRAAGISSCSLSTCTSLWTNLNMSISLAIATAVRSAGVSSLGTTRFAPFSFAESPRKRSAAESLS